MRTRLPSICSRFCSRSPIRCSGGSSICTVILSLSTVSDAFVYLALQRELNFGSGSFPLLYVVTSLSYLLLAVPAGRLADRVGRLQVFSWGYGVLILLYGVLLLGEPSPLLLVIVLLILGRTTRLPKGY